MTFKTNLLLVFLYFVAVFLLAIGGKFYEGGSYLYYLQSMIADWDFNILNQVPETRRWLVTETGFHPDHHPTFQSAPFFIFYLFYNAIHFVLPFSTSSRFVFEMAAVSMNFISLYLSLRIIMRLGHELNISLSAKSFLFFYFSTTVLYFSGFIVNVVSVTLLPFVSYVLLTLVKVRKGKEVASLFLFGLSIGLLLIGKALYWPFCIYSVGVVFWLKRKEERKSIAKIILPALVLFVAHKWVEFLKYGNWENPIGAARAIFNFSPEHFVFNLIPHSFSTGGIFWTNPVYLFSVFGLIHFCWDSFSKGKGEFVDRLFLLLWSLSVTFLYVFSIGVLGEDHLDGRYVIVCLPLIFLGFAHGKERLFKNSILKRALLFVAPFFILWNLWVIFSYMIISLGKPYTYAEKMLVTNWNSQFLTKGIGYIQQNLKDLVDFSPFFVIACFLFSLVTFLARKYFSEIKLTHALGSTTSIVFVLMVFANLLTAQNNIEKMEGKGLYKDAVVGGGPEIYVLDYVADYHQSLIHREPERKEEITEKLDEYYRRIDEQILSAPPEIREKLKSDKSEFSFWSRE